MQAYLGNIAGLVPGHHNKAQTTMKPATLFAGEGSCFQFVTNATSVGAQRNKAQ